LVAAVAGILVGTQMLAGQAQAQEGKSVESSSVTTDNESANLEGNHHYQSAAERANDALLITEVKSALADNGVAEGSSIVIDCDHGKILLSGVMKVSCRRKARREYSGRRARCCRGVRRCKAPNGTPSSCLAGERKKRAFPNGGNGG